MIGSTVHLGVSTGLELVMGSSSERGVGEDTLAQGGLFPCSPSKKQGSSEVALPGPALVFTFWEQRVSFGLFIKHFSFPFSPPKNVIFYLGKIPSSQTPFPCIGAWERGGGTPPMCRSLRL